MIKSSYRNNLNRNLLFVLFIDKYIKMLSSFNFKNRNRSSPFKPWICKKVWICIYNCCQNKMIVWPWSSLNNKTLYIDTDLNYAPLIVTVVLHKAFQNDVLHYLTKLCSLTSWVEASDIILKKNKWSENRTSSCLYNGYCVLITSNILYMYYLQLN